MSDKHHPAGSTKIDNGESWHGSEECQIETGATLFSMVLLKDEPRHECRKGICHEVATRHSEQNKRPKMEVREYGWLPHGISLCGIRGGAHL